MITIKKTAIILSILFSTLLACNRPNQPKQTNPEDIDNRDIPIDDGLDKMHKKQDTLPPSKGQDSAYHDNKP